MKKLSIVAAAITLSACASAPTMMMKVDNATLPEAVRVPAGQKVMISTTGVGEITYECREKKDMAGAHEWAFVGPVATLYSGDRQAVGKYYAGPTWEANDGSKVTGKQLAVSPAAPGNIPLQLVKTDPAMACDAMSKGRRQQVAYEADYVFYGM